MTSHDKMKLVCRCLVGVVTHDHAMIKIIYMKQ